MDDGERALAAAVILQAITDYEAAPPQEPKQADAKARKEYKHRYAVWEHDKFEALRFLTAQSGEWRESRNKWASLAGIDPDAIASKYLQPLAA